MPNDEDENSCVSLRKGIIPKKISFAIEINAPYKKTMGLLKFSSPIVYMSPGAVGLEPTTSGFGARAIVWRKSQQNQLTPHLPTLVSATKSLGKMLRLPSAKMQGEKKLASPSQNKQEPRHSASV